MKYRIIEHKRNGETISFVPQYKWFLFWKSWYTCVCMDCLGEVCFSTEEAAIKYIDGIIESRNIKFTKIVHTFSKS